MRRALALALWACLAPSAPAATYYVTVAGLGGEPDYEQRFAAWAAELGKALAKANDAKSWVLSGKDATRERVRQALAEIAGQAGERDALVVMLIGHGSFDGADYKANLPGPDISAVELAAALDRVPAGLQLVVNMTSASGGSIAALQRPKRAVITATKSGTERNATVFARYWIEALNDPSADADKNEVITALEAFRFADQKTARFYETQKRLATEHPLLEDTGAGEGVRAPSPENGQGLLAARFPLVRLGAAQAALNDPVRRKLRSRKEELEQAIDKLKYEKAALPLDDYKKQLTALLIELARTQAELDRQ